jgi:hypothetical protein
LCKITSAVKPDVFTIFSLIFKKYPIPIKNIPPLLQAYMLLKNIYRNEINYLNEINFMCDKITEIILNSNLSELNDFGLVNIFRNLVKLEWDSPELFQLLCNELENRDLLLFTDHSIANLIKTVCNTKYKFITKIK